MLRAFLRGIFYRAGLHRTRFGSALQHYYRNYRQIEPAGRAPDLPPLSVELPDTSGGIIAVRVAGGIGDHLIAARYMRDLSAAVPNLRFDVYSPRPEAAAWVFRHMPNFNKAYDEYFCWYGREYYRYYAVALAISGFVVVYHDSVKWISLHRTHPRLVRAIETLDRYRHSEDLNEIIHAHPKLDGLLGQKAVYTNLNRHNYAQAMSGIPYGGHAVDIPIDPDVPAKFGLQGKSYITIHNGFDAEFQTERGFAVRSTKVYPHFAGVLKALRTRYPDILVVQLGTKTSRPIPGVDVQLIDRTTLTDTAAILAASKLHIDNESGLVHMAKCIGTTSCVMFGPTPSDYFGYPDNLNFNPKVCGGCWWVTRTWMTSCPRGFERPICLYETPPEEVVAGIIAYFETKHISWGPGVPQPAVAMEVHAE